MKIRVQKVCRHQIKERQRDNSSDEAYVLVVLPALLMLRCVSCHGKQKEAEYNGQYR